MLKGFTHARLACGCRVAFREGVEGSPVAVVVETKGLGCGIAIHVRDLPVYDYGTAVELTCSALESSSAAQLGLTVLDFQQAVTQARFARALFQHLSAELLEYQKNIAAAKQLPDPKRLQELDSRKEAIRREAMFQMQRAMPRQGWTALQTHLNQVFVKP